MGWGAAYALFEECPEVYGSPDEAYDVMYGKQKPNLRTRCPVCSKRLKSQAGVENHIRDTHDGAKKHAEKIAAWRAL